MKEIYAWKSTFATVDSSNHTYVMFLAIIETVLSYCLVLLLSFFQFKFLFASRPTLVMSFSVIMQALNSLLFDCEPCINEVKLRILLQPI